MCENVKLIVIEGNINSGKSTLLKKIGELKDCSKEISIFCEGFGDSEILKKRYESGGKCYGFELQRYIISYYKDLIKRISEQINNVKNNNKKNIFIIERSILSATLVFSNILYESGQIKKSEYEQLILESIESDKFKKIDKYVMIKCSTSTCYSRVMQQNHFSRYISQDYLKQIEQKYENLFSKLENEKKHNISYINGETPIDLVVKQFKKILNKL